MKKIVGVALVAGAATIASAGVPPSLEFFLKDAGRDRDKTPYWTLDSKTKQWNWISHSTVSCDGNLVDAKDAGVADTFTLDIPYDTPDWKAGKHTLKDLQVMCSHAKKSEQIESTVFWFQLGWNDKDQGDIAAKCIQGYNDMLVKYPQISGTMKLPYEGIEIKDPATGDPFKGTLEEGRKKFCDGNAKEFLEAKTKAEAPYRKVLKEDKLDVALTNIDRVWMGPGKKELKTAAAMAAAKVWYRETEYPDSGCKMGENIVHSLMRYEFDAKQKLVKDDSTRFCGPAPASAYK